MDDPKLKIDRDISTEPISLLPSTHSSPHVLVVGAGVIGLTTSWVLLDHGYPVTIVSSKWANNSNEPYGRVTSQIAGALWEYPPAVCGSHTDEVSLDRSKKWAMTSYYVWEQISRSAKAQEAGVKMTRSAFFFPKCIDDDKSQSKKMKEIQASGVIGFERSPKLSQRHGIDPTFGVVDAYELLAPAIETDRSLHWLTKLVHEKGARLVTDTISTDLLTIENLLREHYGVDAIINCSGLGSKTLAADDTCYPLRGALLRFINNDQYNPKIEAALAISADSLDSSENIFIVPRGEDTLIVGGFAEANNWNCDLTLESPPIKRINARAEKFLPALRNAKLDPTYPLAQGLRPAREQNVRLERETRYEGSRIIHSYGHGGSGWSFSFGCALEVMEILEQMLHGRGTGPKSRL